MGDTGIGKGIGKGRQARRQGDGMAGPASAGAPSVREASSARVGAKAARVKVGRDDLLDRLTGERSASATSTRAKVCASRARVVQTPSASATSVLPKGCLLKACLLPDPLMAGVGDRSAPPGRAKVCDDAAFARRPRGRAATAALLLWAMTGVPALAAPPAAGPGPCGAELSTAAAEVSARWTDAGALALSDGGRLVPHGIALPSRLVSDGRLAQAAGAAAAAALEGCAVRFSAARDRHGRWAGPARAWCGGGADRATSAEPFAVNPAARDRPAGHEPAEQQPATGAAAGGPVAAGATAETQRPARTRAKAAFAATGAPPAPGGDHPLAAVGDTVREDPAGKVPAGADAAGNTLAGKDLSRQEPAQQGLARQDLSRKDLTQQNLARQEPAQQNPARKDIAAEAPAGEDLAARLIRAGAGYARPMAGDDACRAARLAAEDEARTARRGLWGLADAVAPANDEAAMAIRAGLFTVAEGRVLAAGGTKERIYLNFGASWRQDFTVMIEREDFATILGDSLEPAMLRGTLVRVRGVVRTDGGPAITVRQAGDIARLSDAGPARRRRAGE